ncbi:hypothetical protein V8F33_013319 [Rhypophila sp. PSN 637]
MHFDENSIPDPGILPQEFHDEYDGARLVITSMVLLVLTTFFMGLRFLSDYLDRKSRKLFFDDVVLLAAYLCFLVLCGIIIAMVALGGMGKHVYTLKQQDPKSLEMYSTLVTPSLVFLYCVLCLSRVAILGLYLRVFKWRRGGMTHTVTVFVMSLIITSLILSIVLSSAVCRPVGFEGDMVVSNGDCARFYWAFRSQMFAGILFDFAIAALPWRTIWVFPVPVGQRMTAIVFLFFASLGMMAWAVKRVVVSYTHTPWLDSTYSSVGLSLWYSTEGAWYIMINCLSRLRPLMLVLLPKRFVNTWGRCMTWLGRVLRIPDTDPEDLRLPQTTMIRKSSSATKGTSTNNNSPNPIFNEDHEWNDDNVGTLGELELGLSKARTRPRGHAHHGSLSFMDDPYMLGPNSRTIGVSSWTIVGPSSSTEVLSEVERTRGRSGDRRGEIQVTVEVSMRTNPRTKSWANV